MTYQIKPCSYPIEHRQIIRYGRKTRPELYGCDVNDTMETHEG